MGADESYQYERNNPKMMIDQYDVNEDPDFDIQKLCDENETIDPVDIINIRHAFLNLRDPENDPPETMRVRKLRQFQFLSAEDVQNLEQIRSKEYKIQEVKEEDQFLEVTSNGRSEGGMLIGSVGPSQRDSVLEVAENLSDYEDKQVIVISNSNNAECMSACYPMNRQNAQSRGIRKGRELPGDNNLVTFEEFFNLMKKKADFTNSGGIKFEQEEKTVSCMFFSW